MVTASLRRQPLPEVALEPLRALRGLAPVDVAEAFRDLPGLALLESARPGRRARWSYLTADPVVVADEPVPGADPFAHARTVLDLLAPGGIDHGPVRRGGRPPGAPPFTGGLVGLLAYDLGRSLERIPSLALDDQRWPPLRLALHDWVVCWPAGGGEPVLATRSLAAEPARSRRRRADVVERLDAIGRGWRPSGDAPPVRSPASFRSNVDRSGYERTVERVREEIARGALYQANVARRLEAPYAGDPWPLYRLLRTGDPVGYAAFLDLGERRRILSASPEPFLSLDRHGRVATDPIKGTRARGRTRTEDRALAGELLASAKDRAENTMIVDVLRNDLGRVCVPGSVRVPRLCRLERTATVQHLVSTVTGRLAPGRDALHLLTAAFPGGSITGAPKIRAMQLIEELEPVRRGPYTGSVVWLDRDGAMGSSIVIRTFVADGERLTLHVGGGITWRSDPGAEWEETRAKARGPIGALGAVEEDALDVPSSALSGALREGGALARPPDGRG